MKGSRPPLGYNPKMMGKSDGIGQKSIGKDWASVV